MDKVLLINKEVNMTSRDVVNFLTSYFETRKIGHFGTLDPMATGLLVIGIGSLTKVGNLFLDNRKEYEVEFLIGTSTDTYDITGNIIEKKDNISFSYDSFTSVINSFVGTYLQEVPIYSAVKVSGKKLYEYAREGKDVILPKKEVTIFSINSISFYEKDGLSYGKFTALVSGGTYIRSLINDISKKVGIPLCMSALNRTKCSSFSILDSYTLEDVRRGKYKLLDIRDIFDLEVMEIPSYLEKSILNGNKIDVISSKDVLFTKDNVDIVLYRKFDDYMKPILTFKK